MSLKKIVGLLAGFALAVGLIGAGVGANFTDQVTAKENINVGTFQCKIVNATPIGASNGIAADGKSVTYTAPEIDSSAAGSAPFSFTVKNTGSIGQVLTVSTSPVVSAPWSIIGAPFAAVPLAAGASTIYNTGISWTELQNANIGQKGTVTWTVNCGENAPAVVFDNTVAVPTHGYALSFNGERTSEYGSQVTFAGTARNLQTATVDVVSYPCQTGSYTDTTCATSSGATYNVPITFNVYAVAPSNAVGALIATKTETFAIPYRPSADPVCAAAPYDAANKFYLDGSCWTALETTVTFDLSSLKVTLPNSAILSVYVPTSGTGTAAPGPWDSFNVVIAPLAPAVGTTPIANTYRNSTQSSFYSDGGATGTFRLDGTVESESPTTSQIAVQIVATY